MLRMKYVVGLAVVLAAGLLSVQVAVCADGAGQAPAAKTGQAPAAKTGQTPATKSGQAPAAKTGQVPATKYGQAPAAKYGQAPAAKAGRGLWDDPEMAELMRKDGQLDRDAHELAMQYRQTTGDRRAKIQQEVEERVNKQFDVRQQRRKLELKRLEGQLQRLREVVSRRERARKELVDKRVSELLGLERELDF